MFIFKHFIFVSSYPMSAVFACLILQFVISADPSSWYFLHVFIEFSFCAYIHWTVSQGIFEIPVFSSAWHLEQYTGPFQTKISSWSFLGPRVSANPKLSEYSFVIRNSLGCRGVCVCMYVCVCVYIYIHIYVYMYIYTHICIHIHIYNFIPLFSEPLLTQTHFLLLADFLSSVLP